MPMNICDQQTLTNIFAPVNICDQKVLTIKGDVEGEDGDLYGGDPVEDCGGKAGCRGELIEEIEIDNFHQNQCHFHHKH